jgi:hypothetical protein
VTARATRFLSDLPSRYSAARLIEDGELAIEGLGPVIASGRHADRDAGCWSASRVYSFSVRPHASKIMVCI